MTATSRSNHSTQQRINAQRKIVAKLEPSSAEHELATKILLLLLDSLHIHQQIDELLIATRRMQKPGDGREEPDDG